MGYPTGGTDGTAVVGIITNNALRCNTTKFGEAVVASAVCAAALQRCWPCTACRLTQTPLPLFTAHVI